MTAAAGGVVAQESWSDHRPEVSHKLSRSVCTLPPAYPATKCECAGDHTFFAEPPRRPPRCLSGFTRESLACAGEGADVGFRRHGDVRGRGEFAGCHSSDRPLATDRLSFYPGWREKPGDLAGDYLASQYVPGGARPTRHQRCHDPAVHRAGRSGGFDR